MFFFPSRYCLEEEPSPNICLMASFRHSDKLLLAGMNKQVEIRSPAPCGVCGVAHGAAVPAQGMAPHGAMGMWE